MRTRQGFTLMEMIVVLIIIAIAAVCSFPNFTTPTEQARAMNAWNNLLAIYSAEKNYLNNNGGFAVGASGASGDAHSLAAIDSTLALNIQDDGTYLYSCSGSTCTATRNNGPSAFSIAVTLTAPIQLTGGTLNPACTPPTSQWCP